MPFLRHSKANKVTIKEDDAAVGDSDIQTIDFGTGFDVAESPDKEVQITLDLSEISAGGELGGTMDAPTVDATHSGSAHHAQSHTHASHTSIGANDHIPDLSKSITVEDPTNAEDISISFTNRAITVTEMRAVLVGSATPSVTWTIRHGTDRSATGAEVVTSGTTTTSTTTGSDVTSFNDATIVADSFVWLETTAKSGTVDEIHITIFYTID